MARRVFLSSVGAGLEAHRLAAHNAITGIGYHSIRMEDFGAYDSTPADLCRAKVLECDIFVGIVGPRYGRCPPGSEFSFTELEYRAAEEVGKPRLLFVTRDKFPLPTDIIENDRTRRKLKRFRAEVINERSAAYFTSPDELATEVVKAIHNSKPGPSLCQAFCLPTLVRPEGYTERMGDIRITVYGVQRPEQVDVALTLRTNVTNRIDDRGITDATLASERQGVLAHGRLEGYGKLLFESVRLDHANPEGDEILTITGVRGAAVHFPVGFSIEGLLDITSSTPDHRVLFHGPLVMALLPAALTFGAQPAPSDIATCLAETPSGESIRSFVVEFTGSFPSAFKTKEEETGGSWRQADQGTVLALTCLFPEGYRLFATNSEISLDNEHDKGPLGKALRVATNAAGAQPQLLDAPASLLWDKRIPMPKAGGLTAWEIMNPLPGPFTSFGLAKLRFGLSLIGPAHSPGSVLHIFGNLAPYYRTASAHQAQPKPPSQGGVNLPVPRFRTVFGPHEKKFPLD